MPLLAARPLAVHPTRQCVPTNAAAAASALRTPRHAFARRSNSVRCVAAASADLADALRLDNCKPLGAVLFPRYSTPCLQMNDYI